MSAFFLILKQTVQLAFRKGGGAFGTVACYVIIVTLFTFALGSESMQEHAGAAMCIGLLLSIVTSLPLFYERDHEEGTLEQFLLLPVMLELLVLAKLIGQWLASIAPILLISPLLAVMANLDGVHIQQAMIMLMLASPTIVSIASIGGALTLGSRRGGLLQALIVMPLYIPVLIFAGTSPDFSGERGAIFLLSGMMFAFVPLSCFVSAALIRISQD